MALAKAVTLVIINFIATALFWFHAGTSWISFNTGTTRGGISFWQSCITSQTNSSETVCTRVKDSTFNGCLERLDLINAGRAFSIFASFFISIFALVCLYRIFNNGFITGKIRNGYLCMNVLVLICGILGCIDAVALYHVEFCSLNYSENSSTNKMGPSAFTGAAATALCFISIVLECCLSNKPAVVANDDEDEMKDDDDDDDFVSGSSSPSSNDNDDDHNNNRISININNIIIIPTEPSAPETRALDHASN